MNLPEAKIIDVLTDLKENHHILSVKAEFEAEGTHLEEALRLKDIISDIGLDLTIKIGGCEAVKDIYDAKTLNATTIVAPMIESTYAVRKFINAIRNAFSNEEQRKLDLFINIETITGFKCLEEILNEDYAPFIKGVVLGRTDMCGSLKIDKSKINSDVIFDYALAINKILKKYNKEFIIGGGVCVESLEFFKKLPENSLDKFETRKVIFDAKKVLSDKNASIGILKALLFEIMWIKNKRENYGLKYKEDEFRLTMLEERYNKLVNKDKIYVK